MSFFEMLNSTVIGPIKLLFEIIFSLANRWIAHPGLSIICLSLAINILVLPLYMRADVLQKKSRDKEAALRDGIAHIKKTFTGDERMMILQTYYRQNDYSPFSAINGSISLLLQIPFFMAAVQVLSNLPALNGASLGPIKDLGAPDGLLVIGTVSINLLPIIMTLINFTSSALFSRGFPLKTKVQLYGLAIFFLVFLYNYPSGLVFYWILNNVFSLVKTIFYKLKNPKKVLTVMCAVLGMVSFVYNIFFLKGNYPMRRLFLVIVGCALLLPMIIQFISNRIKRKELIVAAPNKKMFFSGAIFLTVLTGLVIPTNFVAASPQEYVDLTYFYHPIWYVVSAFCLSIGTFIIWLQVFYRLANDKVKTIFDKLVWVACCVATVNYLFFGTKLGNISSTLRYDTGLVFSYKEIVINILVVLAVVAVALLLASKWRKAVISVALCGAIAFSGMSVLNISTIMKSVNQISEEQLTGVDKIFNINLSKNGKNVVFIMLDRAMGEYLPYILNEKPELKEKFSGFTYYPNTISFGGKTNFGSPSLIGGYEYTPVELNKRSDELLVEKHNEALMVMPTVFAQNGYKTSVADPVYANYSWIPDLTLFDNVEGVEAYHTNGKYTAVDVKQAVVESNTRNFFCFSIMKSVPVALQSVIYNNGVYNQQVTDNDVILSTRQTITSMSTASGNLSAFIDEYNFLDSLPYITTISDDSQNTFTEIFNAITHEAQLLQAPDYIPVENVDNTEYDKAYSDRFTVNGVTLPMENTNQMAHYHVNISALLRIAEWLDYLRENDVYDNTKIIITSDHGQNLYHFDNMIIENNGDMQDMSLYYPLLLVKDFDSEEFSIDTQFMTNADVPTLAFEGAVENPVNPFTNKPINSNEKFAHEQYIIVSKIWQTDKNNGYTFLDANWISVDGTQKTDNIWNASYWKYYDSFTVLDEHKNPDE